MKNKDKLLQAKIFSISYRLFPNAYILSPISYLLSPSRGFLLIEVLVASVLISLAGSGLYSGLMQGVKAERMIREVNALYDPLRVAWMKTEKDLRNAIALRDYKFQGTQDEMIFANLVPGTAGTGSELRNSEPVPTVPGTEVRLIRYFVKDGRLIRSEVKLPESFVKEAPSERILLKGIKSIRFQYAYLDEEEKLVFKSFWVEEPYFGIPKAVRIEVKMKGCLETFSRLVAIPQGKWGRVSR